MISQTQYTSGPLTCLYSEGKRWSFSFMQPGEVIIIMCLAFGALTYTKIKPSQAQKRVTSSLRNMQICFVNDHPFGL